MKKNILVIVLGLALLGSVGYIVYDKTMTNNTKTETEDKNKFNVVNNEKNSNGSAEVEEKLNTDSLFVKELVERYYRFPQTTPTATANQLYVNQNTNPAEMTDAYAMAVTNAYLYGYSITTEQLHTAMVKLFGPNVVVNYKDFVMGGCDRYTYNQANKTFDFEKASACGGSSFEQMKRKIVEATKINNEVKITVAVAIVNLGDQTVKKPSGEIISGVTSDNFDIEKDYAKTDKYQYTFAYDETNYNYYLTSIKKI